MPEGRGLSVHVTVGEVRITGEARTDAVAEFVRRAPDAMSLARALLVVDERPDRVEIRALQLDGGTDARIRTDVRLRVPKGARVDEVQIFEGEFHLSSTTGAVRAVVQRGPIDARDVSGSVRLETHIGHVLVRQARLVTGGLLRLRTFNGDVRLGLVERPADARVMALALNGSITSDIPLTMRDTWGPRWGEATIGRGENVISIDVVTGKIQISSPD